MATRNMLDSFKKTGLNVFESKNNLPSKIYSTDFFLRPPAWTASKSKKKIGYFYWEADKLPPPWASSLKTADEIWAPCNLVRDVCLASGFRGPIKILPTPQRNWKIDFSGKIELPNISDNTFKFYSIFQWHTRKGWKELLTSYFTEFKKEDDVVLILKVNSIHGTNGNRLIHEDILNLKNSLNQTYYPPIFLIDSFISPEQIYALHEYADCYVSPHHGEGWGMPIHDAIFAKKHLIITKYGGITEFLDQNSANIIEHTMGPVKDMEWNAAYNSGQNWAYPSMDHLKFLMRDVYENFNSERLILKTKMLDNLIKNTSIEAVSKQILSLI
jgi:hypothetical protein